MNDTTYNGWTNYETWVTKLWIDNDQGSQEYWTETAQWLAATRDKDDTIAALAAQLENEHDEGIPETVGVYADLLQRALGMVDWYEIALALIDDAEIDFTTLDDAA